MAQISWRAFLAVFAMLYTLVTMQACTRDSGDQSVGITVSDVPVQSTGIVNILQSQSGVSRPLQQAIELYAASNPGAHINVQTVGSLSDYRVTLRSKLLAGEQVDVFQFVSGREARELEGYLADLSHLAWVGDAAEGTLSAVQINGKTLGIPYSLEGYGLLANRNIFEVADIPLGGILTFQDLSEAFQALDEIIDEKTLAEDFPNLRYVTELPFQDRGYLGTFVADLALYGSFENPGRAVATTDISYPQSEGVESLVRLLMRYGPRATWEESDGLSWNEQLEQFASGRIAVILADTESYRQVIAWNPELENRVALLPIPLEGVPTSTIATGTPLYWGIHNEASEESRQSAERFLTWLYQSESGTAVLASRFGIVSPYLATGKETGLSTHRQMLSLIDQGRTVPVVWREFPADWGSSAFAPGLRSWVTGDLEWEEMLAAGREAWAYAS